MKIIQKTDSLHPNSEIIQSAADCLKAGKLVVFPTETVYGIAADPLQPKAIESLFQAKGRDFNKPVAYFVSCVSQIKELGAHLPPAAQKLAEKCWPGPLTLVLPGPSSGFLGFRMPNHAIPLALLNQFKRVIAVTSANASGQPDALNATQAVAAFDDQVALYIDGGTVSGAVPSTVVQIATDNRIKILRQGSLSEMDITQITCEEPLFPKT